jgi:hypothetical protein
LLLLAAAANEKDSYVLSALVDGGGGLLAVALVATDGLGAGLDLSIRLWHAYTSS